MRLGLDRLVAADFAPLRGRTIGLLVNQGSVASDYRHAVDLFRGRTEFRLGAIFGPQHGLYGVQQDNMIEWEGGVDPRLGVPVHSLYGTVRKPTPEMLAGLDTLVIDLPDVGSRYYTFVWTMALAMEACAEAGIAVVVLDRPNPIGNAVEGPVLDPRFSSFVGLREVPTRHGMTIGEMARFTRPPSLDLTVIEADGFDPSAYLDEIPGAAWAMPSPNMPTVDTAVVYPGGCLLEATTMSEGRGTTRPFEIFGAPWLDAFDYSARLNDLNLPGCVFRALPFEPTFNKHARKPCGGTFLHVTDRRSFRPLLTYVAAMQEAIRLSEPPSFLFPDGGEAVFSTASSEVERPHFAWKNPPYEYVHDRLPIDILAGNDWLRPAIETLEPLTRIAERMDDESATWSRNRR